MLLFVSDQLIEGLEEV